MAFSLSKFLKGVNVREENTLTPKEIDIIPGGTAGTKTTITTSQTSNITITLPASSATLVDTTSSQVLTNKSIDADTNTITNIDNNEIKAAAAIDVSKLAALTASRAVASDASGFLTPSATTDTELGYVSGVTSAIQTQLNAKQASGNYITALSGDVVATGPGSVAATIQPQAVDNAKVANAAAIALSKLAATTINRALVSDASGFVSPATTTATEIGYVNGVTSAIQTQLDAKVAKSTYSTKGSILAATAASTPADLPPGTFGQVLTVDSSATPGLKWASPATGAKNYIAFNNFENNATTGWSLSHSTIDATTKVPNQASGSWTSASGNLSISAISSGQLAGSYSLSLASSAATTAGDMLVSDAFTIDIEDQAKPMTVKFYYKAVTNPTNGNYSGTSSNSFSVQIYDVTNGVWIQPAGTFGMVQNSGVGYCTATFQTTSNSTQYRLAISNATATSGATTLYFDDFFLGPQTAPLGAVITDPVAYTPTFTGFGTPSSVNFKSWRAGKYLFVSGTFVNGTPTATEGRITLGFNGISGNVTTSSTLPTLSRVGDWSDTGTSSTTDFRHRQVLIEASKTYMTFGSENSTAGGSLVKQNGNAISPTGITISLDGVFEIEGWSSNVQMSNDTDTREVSLFATKAAGNQTNNNGYEAVQTFNTATTDTHASFNATTGTYTIPVSGRYRVSATMAFAGTATGFVGVRIHKNGTSTVGGSASPNNTVIGGASTATGTIPCVAGDTITFQAYQNSGGNLAYQTGASSNISIERLSGPSVIASTETIAMRVNAATPTGSLSAASAVIFGTAPVFDTHGRYSTSTGQYTVPVSGFYQVYGQISISGTEAANQFIDISVYKNTTVQQTMRNRIQAATTDDNEASVSTLVQAVAGDTIELRVNTNITGAAFNANAAINFFQVQKVGN